MRILHAVEYYDPSVGGAQEVVRQISKRLASRGHEVTVATSRDTRRSGAPIDGVAVREFQIRGNAVRGMSGDVDAYRRLVIEGGFDVVMTYAAQQWTTDALLPVLGQIPGVRMLAPCGFSGLRRHRYRAYFADMPSRLAEFDHLIFHSDAYQDTAFARTHGLANWSVIPNGADEAEFDGDVDAEATRSDLGLDPDRPLLVSIGSHTGRKGHGLLMHAFARSKAGRTGTLLLIGNRPWRVGCSEVCSATAHAYNRRHERIRLASFPRHETLRALRSADLLVHCSPIECSPLVLFEAAAAGVDFVALDSGNAREIAGWVGGGRVIPKRPRTPWGYRQSVVDIATAIDDSLRDPAKRALTGATMRAAWRDGFTWDAIADQYEHCYATAIADKGASGPAG